eukprot:1707337-Pleurochrysis_carterae.AAC.2
MRRTRQRLETASSLGQGRKKVVSQSWAEGATSLLFPAPNVQHSRKQRHACSFSPQDALIFTCGTPLSWKRRPLITRYPYGYQAC